MGDFWCDEMLTNGTPSPAVEMSGRRSSVGCRIAIALRTYVRLRYGSPRAAAKRRVRNVLYHKISARAFIIISHVVVNRFFEFRKLLSSPSVKLVQFISGSVLRRVKFSDSGTLIYSRPPPAASVERNYRTTKKPLTFT